MYSCSGSPDRLSNGSTAIDGLSGNGNAISSIEAGVISGLLTCSHEAQPPTATIKARTAAVTHPQPQPDA